MQEEIVKSIFFTTLFFVNTITTAAVIKNFLESHFINTATLSDIILCKNNIKSPCLSNNYFVKSPTNMGIM